MKEEYQVEVKYNHENTGDIALSTSNGRELVYFGEQGVINRALKAKKGDRFLVTIEKLKPKGK